MYFLSVNKIKPDVDRTQLNRVIPLHREWVKEQIKAGRVVQAGKWGDRGGIIVVKAESRAEADRLVDQDPLVREGLITFETDEIHAAVPFR